MAKKKDTSRKKSKSPQKYTFDFTLSGLISLFVFSILIMIWMFILGILVGRGYRPENLVPQLAKILPHSQETAANSTSPNRLTQAGPKGAETDPTLKPEDLTYFEDLKKSKPRAVEPAPTARKSPPRQPEPQQISPKPEDKEPLYRYIYQVAAFKEEDRAKAFRDRILKMGHSSYVSKEEAGGQSWFRVYVSHDAGENKTGGLLRDLKSLGVEKAFLRSKKPL